MLGRCILTLKYYRIIDNFNIKNPINGNPIKTKR
jgi:hypothetical protein